MTRLKTLALSGALLLGGCVSSLTPHGGAIQAALDSGIEQTIQDVKNGNDRFSNITAETSCMQPLGAWGREGLKNMVTGYGRLLMCPEAYNLFQALNAQFKDVQLPVVKPLIGGLGTAPAPVQP